MSDLELGYQFLPYRNQSAGLRRQITATALRVFAGWGYQELEVPLVDDFDVLKRGLSADQVEHSLRFLDRSGRVMILRSDCTPSVAKTLSYQIGRSQTPQRVCYANQVLRIKESRTKSQLESMKVGVELIGLEGASAEIEVVCICLEVLRRLDVTSFQINITDHKLVQRVLRMTGAPERVRKEVRDAIIARDVSQVTAVLEHVGIRKRFIEGIQILADIEGGIQQLERLKGLLGGDVELRGRIEKLELLMDSLQQLGFSDFVRIDLASLRLPHYYDGFAFTVVSENVGKSIGGGGRYDELYGAFGQPAAAVGFSLDVELLCELVYPKVSLQSPHLGLPEGVSVEETDLVRGFQEVLARREQQQTTRVVVVKGGRRER